MVAPYPYGVRMTGCRDIAFHGVHVYSPTKFSYDAAIYDATHGVEVRPREIAALTAGRPPSVAFTLELERLATGFELIDGATVDRAGNVYFVDGRWHCIYRWPVGGSAAELVSDIPIAPVGLV